MPKKKSDVQNPEEEAKPLCPKCGTVMIIEDGELVCPSCGGEIDWLGDDEE